MSIPFQLCFKADCQADAYKMVLLNNRLRRRERPEDLQQMVRVVFPILQDCELRLLLQRFAPDEFKTRFLIECMTANQVENVVKPFFNRECIEGELSDIENKLNHLKNRIESAEEDPNRFDCIEGFTPQLNTLLERAMKLRKRYQTFTDLTQDQVDTITDARKHAVIQTIFTAIRDFESRRETARLELAPQQQGGLRQRIQQLLSPEKVEIDDSDMEVLDFLPFTIMQYREIAIGIGIDVDEVGTDVLPALIVEKLSARGIRTKGDFVVQEISEQIYCTVEGLVSLLNSETN